jgi:FeS assembly protein IscX
LVGGDGRARLIKHLCPSHLYIKKQTGVDHRLWKVMDRLYWDDAYAIALALIECHPSTDPLAVNWETLHDWVVELPDFADDADLKHTGWLRGIQKEWYEEVTS